MPSTPKKKRGSKKKSTSLRRSMRTKEEAGTLKLQKVDYLGLDHKMVCEKMEGELRFVNYFSINSYNGAIAVYHNAKPDRSKSHKDYMLLYNRYEPHEDKFRLYVSGIDEDKIQDKDRYRSALRCEHCGETIYSAYRHDYRTCECGDTFIDGGSEYARWGGGDGKSYTIDMLTDKVTENP